MWRTVGAMRAELLRVACAAEFRVRGFDGAAIAGACKARCTGHLEDSADDVEPAFVKDGFDGSIAVRFVGSFAE